MQRDRWKEITRIFHAALDLPPEQRPGFVCTAASGDPDLQVEVERLLLADQQADSYLESPLIPAGAFSAALSDEPQLRPGDVLCQRFHVLRTVGSGGMGQVFEAHDSELAVNVALKLIRPEIAANPQALARFRQEVRLARRITHPNVCRTFDLDRDTLTTPEGSPRTLVFLTMEFLAGETLAARLKRSGRLIPEEILSISRQIAAALEAAHAIGIVHRDIKPGNIMLVPAGENSRQPARVVITDFGLARLDPVFSQDENSITQHSSHSAHPIGTLAYMAPEQMDGRPISAATDIYAFGLLLFEMATGQRAFPSSNLLSGIAQRLSGPSPSPTTLQPALPDSLEQAVQGCLRLNPEERFQSAQVVLECLTGQSQPLPTPATPASRPQPSPGRQINWTSRNTLLSAAAILLLAVSLFLLGLRYHWWEGNAKLDPGALVYLAPVTNQTGEKSLDNITELLQASLEQSAQINLLDQGRVGDLMERMTIPPDTPITQKFGREIALRANAARVIFAQVAGSQGHYTLNIDIQRTDYTPARFRSHWTQSFPWQVTSNTNAGTIPQELTSTLREASDWVRNKVGESRNDIARLDVRSDDITTGKWDALQEFNLAMRLQQQLKTEQAIQHLKQAVAIDPNFALAYGRLGDFEFSAGSGAEGLQDYAKALDLSELERLSLRERDAIRGLAASDSGDFEASAEAFRNYTVNYPHDYLGWFYLGYQLIMLGRKEEGFYDTQRAVQISPSSLAPPYQEGLFSAATGNTNAAKASAAQIEKMGKHGLASYVLGIDAFVQADYSNAERHFLDVEASQSRPGRTRAIMIRAHLAAEQGKYQHAIDLLNEGIDDDNRNGRNREVSAKLIDRAALEIRRGSSSKALDDIRKSLAIDLNEVRIASAAALVGSAVCSASPAEKSAMQTELTELDRSYSGTELGNYSKIAKYRLHAAALLAMGQWQLAVRELKKADVLDAPVSGRGFLAFALTTAGHHESDPATRQSLLHEALAAYSHDLQQPGIIWQALYRNPPGFLADEMSAFLDLAAELNQRGPDVENARLALAKLRPTAPSARSN